jgi:hypothetical protein
MAHLGQHHFLPIFLGKIFGVGYLEAAFSSSVTSDAQKTRPGLPCQSFLYLI